MKSELNEKKSTLNSKFQKQRTEIKAEVNEIKMEINDDDFSWVNENHCRPRRGVKKQLEGTNEK